MGTGFIMLVKSMNSAFYLVNMGVYYAFRFNLLNRK